MQHNLELYGLEEDVQGLEKFIRDKSQACDSLMIDVANAAEQGDLSKNLKLSTAARKLKDGVIESRVIQNGFVQTEIAKYINQNQPGSQFYLNSAEEIQRRVEVGAREQALRMSEEMKEESLQLKQQNRELGFGMSQIVDSNEEVLAQNKMLEDKSLALELQCKDLNSEVERLNEENEILAEKQRVSKIEASICKIKRSHIKLAPDQTLLLDLEKERDGKILRFLSRNKLRLPTLNKVKLVGVYKEKEAVEKFLTDCLPEQLQNLSLSNGRYSCDMLPLSPKIVKACASVSEKVHLNNYKLASKQMSSLIKACSHIHALVLEDCDVSSSGGFVFRTQGRYSLSKIYLQNTGNRTSTYQTKENARNLSSLLAAIGRSGLKNSLTVIGVQGLNCSKIDSARIEATQYGITAQIADEHCEDPDEL